MTKGEYWILETAVEARIPLACLASCEIEEIFNKPGHGLDHQELVSTLKKLFDRGEIVARTKKAHEHQLTVTDLERALDIPPGTRWSDSVYYGLTVPGGKRWEESSEANWGCYIRERYSPGSPKGSLWSGEIITMDRGRLEKYLGGIHFMGTIIVPGSEAWDILAPWEATYWKTLPVGHRVRFQYKRERRGNWNWAQVPRWFMEMRNWFTAPQFL